MTPPHPALLRLARTGEAGRIGDEDLFLRSASEHRMTGAVLAAQRQSGLRLSARAATVLAMGALAERRRHLLFWRAVRDAEAALAGTGVQVAVLKGVATEARWYDEMGERVCTDLDLLLAPGALDTVGEVVGLLDPDRGARAAIEQVVHRRLVEHVDLRFGGVAVDLHLDPLKMGVPTRQLDEVWSSTQRLETPHGTIRVLRPEVELVMLLLHLNKDLFAFLGPFLDIGRILDRATLDWDDLRAFVAREGWDVPVWKSLAAVTEVLGRPVDAPRVRGPRAWAWDRLWGPGARLRGDEGRDRAPSVQLFLPLHAAGRAADKARHLRRQLLPQRELAEVAGRLRPGEPYLRYLASRRRRRARAGPDRARSGGAALELPSGWRA